MERRIGKEPLCVVTLQYYHVCNCAVLAKTLTVNHSLIVTQYFELHRGTYTSHAMAKRYNRKCELLLRDAELLATLAAYIDRPSPACKSEKNYRYVLCLKRMARCCCLNSIRQCNYTYRELILSCVGTRKIA